MVLLALPAGILALPPLSWTELRAWAQPPPAGDPETEPVQAVPGLFPVLVPAPVAEPAGRARPPVSPVIFPAQRIPLRFSHVLHLGLPQAPACADCHAGALRSMSSLDNLLPTEQACRACHAIDRSQPEKAVAAGAPPARCDACHVGYQPGARLVDRVAIPAPNLKFPHRTHMAQGMTCASCHGDLAAERVAGLGTSVWVGVGGDPVKGTRFADLVPFYAQDAATRALLVIGEIGGNEEEELAAAIAASRFAKPVFALVAGRRSPEGVTMGHAGALLFGRHGTFDAKRAALEGAGAQVFDSLETMVAGMRAWAARDGAA